MDNLAMQFLFLNRSLGATLRAVIRLMDDAMNFTFLHNVKEAQIVRLYI
jgi:hypothetical protein